MILRINGLKTATLGFFPLFLFLYRFGWIFVGYGPKIAT